MYTCVVIYIATLSLSLGQTAFSPARRLSIRASDRVRDDERLLGLVSLGYSFLTPPTTMGVRMNSNKSSPTSTQLRSSLPDSISFTVRHPGEVKHGLFFCCNTASN